MNFRLFAAAAVLASAGIHLKLWFDGFRYLPTVGPLFLLNVAGGVAIAGLLIAWKHWLPAVLTMLFGGATLMAFITATTVGLFGDHEVWQGRYVFGAAGVELLAIIAGAALILMFDDEAEPEPTRGRHIAGLVRVDNEASVGPSQGL
jgi:hypothetical protein